MNPMVAPTSFEHVSLPMPQIERIETRSASSCCQRAVAEAMENTASMGSIATVTMLMVGFAIGLTTAWALFD
jgi:hypothetical protein